MANTRRPAPTKRALPVEDEAVNGENIAVELEGQTLEVIPLRLWPSSANRAFRQGDFETWAEKCLYRGEFEEDGEEIRPDSYAVWQQIDPNIEQALDVFNQWHAAGGDDLGKLSGSSRPTPRR